MRGILKFIQISFSSLLENKSRTVLTMLGIVIGIGSVVLMTSLGKGAEAVILSSVQSFGARSIFVQPGGGSQGGPPSITAIDKVKYKDYVAVKDLDYIENVTPISVYQGRVTYQNEALKTRIVGTNTQYPFSINVDVKTGRFITNADIDSAKRVAVVGLKVADQFFGDQDPIGKIIKIKNKNFLVIGVMGLQGQRFFQDFDERVLIPITTMRNQINGADYVQTILANVRGDIDEAIDDLRVFIRKRHNNYNPNNDPNIDDFRVVSQVDAVDTFKQVSGALTLFLVLIAGISLLVGGIGIMNIMLVVVSERTREIGLRKAVGATNQDIMRQFLTEAVVITFLGGLIGVGGGIGASYLISLVIVNFQASWRFIVPIDSVITSFVVTVLVGLVFGIYPARNASKLSPIEALRSE